MTRNAAISLSLAVLAAATGLTETAAAKYDRRKAQSTQLITRALGGGLPNGPSTHAVISGDRRWARAIAFESDASNLVRWDTNGVRDVFVTRRAGRFGNTGTKWKRGATIRVSRPRGGGQANGPSWGASIGGAFRKRPHCIGFLSSATNLVGHDTNGKVDAFVVKMGGGKVRRVSLPGNRQSNNDTTSLVVSGDCSRFTFVNGGYVYTRHNGRTKRIGYGLEPSYSTGLKNELVFAGPAGIYLSKNGLRKPHLIVHGGRNPAYNDIKRQVVAYERRVNGHAQIYYRDLGRPEHAITKRNGRLGNGDSTDPVIGNSGYYVSFESHASNLSTDAARRARDYNGMPDSYLYTNVRNMTIAQSVFEKGVPLPGGGNNPSMSFYANYIVFDTPGALRSTNAPHQVYMRYLGKV